MDVQQGFRPTFTGSRQEHWVIDALAGFYEDKWLTDVLYRVKAGTTILMEYVGDASRPAPTLHEVRLDPEEAEPMFDRLMRNVELFLACDRVHGDLSAYNILCWDGQCQIIDLPQSLDPNTNPSALFLLSRDVERLCQYFARYGVGSEPGELVEDLWWRFLHAQLTPVPVRGEGSLSQAAVEQEGEGDHANSQP